MASPAPFVAKPFVPAGDGDSRSPCPALNALANHNYLPHDGRDLRFIELVNVLRIVYRLSLPLAVILALAGFVLCGTFTCKPRAWSQSPHNANERTIARRVVDALPLPRFRLDLHDLAKHGRIEHDASIGHDDALQGARFAPSQPDLHLVDELAQTGIESQPIFPTPETKETTSLQQKGAGAVVAYGVGAVDALNLGDLALARFNRTSHLPPGHKLSSFHKIIATGECALILSVLSIPAVGSAENRQIPRRWIKEWFGEERLPQGWVPPQEEVGLKVVGKLRTAVTTEIARLERYS
ncbi:Cloroperoxidase [Schizopora paradoxa]|uniref:Cloroperoxidase n=1 Tax=Schizopora paradoxa TaxID=27342 RepID=A0A0H2S7E7_9AGAM|nr:Cloroperoxidase [Schizopora paradoxa]